MQTFSSESSILNYVHILPLIASENKEEFNLSLSKIVGGLHISNTLGIL